MTAADWPYHSPTVIAIVERLRRSKYRVHHGAANLVAEEFLPDPRVAQVEQLAHEHGWPAEAVMAGFQLGKVAQ